MILPLVNLKIKNASSSEFYRANDLKILAINNNGIEALIYV
jgi:hypothetical protein